MPYSLLGSKGFSSRKGPMNPWRPSAPLVMSPRVVRAGENPDYLGGRDGDDRQVVPPEAKSGNPEDERENGREPHSHQHREQGVEVPESDRQSHPVGAHGHEAHLPEVEESRIPEMDVEPHGRQCVHGSLQTQRCLHRLDQDESPVDRAQSHSYPNRSLLPRMPCGRTTSTSASTTRAPMFFNSTGMNRVESWMPMPTRRHPSSAP